MSRRLMWAFVLTLVLIIGARLIIQSLIIQRLDAHNISFASHKTAINTIVSMRDSVSRGELECTVVNEPS